MFSLRVMILAAGSSVYYLLFAFLVGISVEALGKCMFLFHLCYLGGNRKMIVILFLFFTFSFDVMRAESLLFNSCLHLILLNKFSDSFKIVYHSLPFGFSSCEHASSSDSVILSVF